MATGIPLLLGGLDGALLALLAAGLYVTVGVVAALVAEVVVWGAVVWQLPAATSRRPASDPVG